MVRATYFHKESDSLVPAALCRLAAKCLDVGYQIDKKSILPPRMTFSKRTPGDKMHHDATRDIGICGHPPAAANHLRQVSMRTGRCGRNTPESGQVDKSPPKTLEIARPAAAVGVHFAESDEHLIS
ncbi:hypothetical protein NKJ48_30610 [Mesorhizobium sp. M0114]|uniref:hypothetical protein n=1 Tax=unclassified Mesorhizobium TaxID=325217 RepID=UPI003338C213